MILCKYYPADSANFIFKEKCISARFSQSECLNDPFELNPATTEETYDEDSFFNWLQFPQNIISNLTDREKFLLENTLKVSYLESAHQYIKERLTNDIGIFSLSQNENSNPLWAYYSKDHKGFMIKFKEDLLVFLDSFTHNEVSYDKNSRPKDFLKFKDLSPEDKKRFMMSIIFQKSPDWALEQEYRFFSYLSEIPSNSIDGNGLALHLKDIPHSLVESITLGINANIELKRKIIYWLNSIRDCSIELRQAVDTRDSYTLKYDPIDLIKHSPTVLGHTSDTPND